jgi:hypothetical protein
MGVGGHLQAPAALPLGKRPGTHRTGSPRVGLNMENLPSRTSMDVNPGTGKISVVYPGTHSHVIATIIWEVSSSSI